MHSHVPIKDKVIIKDSYHCVNLEKKTLNRHYKKVAEI